MVEVTLKFPSTDAAQEFLTWFNSRKAPANPSPEPEADAIAAGLAAEAKGEKKRGRPPKTQQPQATVGASADAASGLSNGASVPSSAPTTAGAKGTEPVQLPLTGVEPAPVAQDVPQITHSAPAGKEYTMDEMKTAAQAVITKFGQIEGMAKARDLMVQIAGVKLIRDVPADKVSQLAAAFEAAVK